MTDTAEAAAEATTDTPAAAPAPAPAPAVAPPPPKIMNHRPSRLSMEGYIFNGDKVLEVALNPDSKQVPAEWIQNCLGVCLLSVTHVGAAFLAAHYGTGVMLAKKAAPTSDTTDTSSTEWSLPVSVMTGGYSMGLVVGGKTDHMIIFIMNQETLDDFISKPVSRMGLDSALSVGKTGGVATLGVEAQGRGSVTMVYTHGVYVGAAVTLGTVAHAKSQNEVFYGEDTKVKQIILNENGKVAPPDDMKEQLDELDKKLNLLLHGKTWTPTPEDMDRSERHRLHAQASTKNFQHDDISGSRHKRLSA